VKYLLRIQDQHDQQEIGNNTCTSSTSSSSDSDSNSSTCGDSDSSVASTFQTSQITYHHSSHLKTTSLGVLPGVRVEPVVRALFDVNAIEDQVILTYAINQRRYAVTKLVPMKALQICINIGVINNQTMEMEGEKPEDMVDQFITQFSHCTTPVDDGRQIHAVMLDNVKISKAPYLVTYYSEFGIEEVENQHRGRFDDINAPIEGPRSYNFLYVRSFESMIPKIEIDDKECTSDCLKYSSSSSNFKVRGCLRLETKCFLPPLVGRGDWQI
jgi:hypothetical protein